MTRSPGYERASVRAADGGTDLRVVGLFAGIGGIELGLHAAGHETVLLCELDGAAQAVLRARFPDVPLAQDVTKLDRLPEADLVTAGFPCQDLSQAGRTAGIGGSQSSLVGNVFRLFDAAEHPPRWLCLENVPFMLQLDRGQAMSYLVDELTSRGFRWAYRTVDTRAFGLPQRRRRVILLASRVEDPRPVLFSDEVPPVDVGLRAESACGFYWTEGLRGLGWAVEAVPTLKGGSSLGIPSPPAVWLRASDELVLPNIRDAERLQGFPADWTAPAATGTARRGPRWKLVGNAVSVPVARWLGERLRSEDAWQGRGEPRAGTGSWPPAAWGDDADVRTVEISTWPRAEPYTRLSDFLQFPSTALSHRAATGFLKRTRRSSLRFAPGFIDAVERHAARTDPAQPVELAA